MRRSFIKFILLASPFLWQVALAPFANAVRWTPLGLPFQLVWQMAGVLLASAAIGTVFLIDERRIARTRAGGEDAA